MWCVLGGPFFLWVDVANDAVGNEICGLSTGSRREFFQGIPAGVQRRGVE